jgi:hypothetical protein
MVRVVVFFEMQAVGASQMSNIWVSVRVFRLHILVWADDSVWDIVVQFNDSQIETEIESQNNSTGPFVSAT